MGDEVGFGDLLRRHRTAAGLTQDELAERAGLSLRGLSDLERGARRTPYRDTVLRLAEALGLEGPERAGLLATIHRPRAEMQNPMQGPGRRPLAMPLSSFVGREREVAEVRRMLALTRLVTLTGTGGIGKTRLALQVCSEVVDDYPGGVWLVELAPVGDPGLLLNEVAAALGVPEESGRPLLETLVAALPDVRCLLVLDNCEHLLAAVAELADGLLRRVPIAHVLATSREPLRTSGETVWQVPSLSLPALRAVGTVEPDRGSEAVRLFVERAAAIQAGFELNPRTGRSVQLICQRLDGIPLAIELAAAWITSVSPEQLVARLDASPRFLVGGSRTAPPRHQTMDAAIRWSYDLLSEAERRLFARVSVFAGGFGLDAAEAVCGDATTHRDETVWLLRQLVAKSLVIAEADSRGTMRYRLLEPLRDFGAALLGEDPEARAVRDRHGAFYVALVRQSPQVISGGPAVAWNEQLLVEYDNLNAALRRLLETGEVEGAQLAGAALAQIWRRRGHLGEGRALLTKLMALPTGAEPTAARQALLIAAGQAAQSQADFDAARALFAECVDVSRRVGDPLATALALSHLSDAARVGGDLAGARAHAEEGLADIRASGDGVPEALLTQRVALAYYAADDLQQACLVMEQALPSLRAGGWTRRVAEGLQILAAGVAQRGDRPAARRLLDEALDHCHQVSDLWGAAKVRIELARLEADGPDAGAAYDRLATSLSLCSDIGDRWGIALALEVGAGMAAAAHDDNRAARLAGAAAALRAAVRVPASPRERLWLQRRLDGAHRRLGQARYARASHQGGALSIEAAIEVALRHTEERIGGISP